MSDNASTSPVLSIIVVLLVAILLAVTNPSADAHRDAMAASYSHERPLAGAVGLGAVSAAVPSYQSFVLGSYTTVGETVTSIGALGMVKVIEPES
jgi:hypothetical protein